MFERFLSRQDWMECPDAAQRIEVTAVTDIETRKYDLYRHGNDAGAEVKAEKEGGMKPQATVEMVKRMVDVVVGLFGTMVFILAYPILALVIKMESAGPAIYHQSRVGRDRRSKANRRDRDALPPGTERRWNDDRRQKNVGGQVFTIHKFRTMRLDAEKAGPQLCGKGGDSRVTGIGNILRKLHLDELPQFWNVLKGDMSFIGPRPERPHFTVQYAEQVPFFSMRTRFMKPGILGLAQIVNGYDDSLESVVRKTHLDLAYGASMVSLTAWLRVEAWIFVNTFLYYATGKPLSEIGRLPAFVPAQQVFKAGASAPLAVAAKIAEGAMTESAPTPTSVLDRLGADSRENAPGLAVAMVRHRDTLKPTLVYVKNRVEGADKVERAERFEKAPEIKNFFTIDVECWFHAHNLNIPKSTWDSQPTRVVENVRRILDLLKTRNAKATFFTLGYVADRFPEIVRMIDAEGHEIGTHGYMHDKVTDMTPYEFEKDLDRSLNALSKGTSRKIIGHRASNFSIVEGTLWALEILAKYGIEYDSSIFPVQRERYGIPDYPNRMPHTVHLAGGASIKEVPMSTLNLGAKALPISGGGYLRLYPYAVTDMFIRRRNSQGLPAMVYFHPWELDANQERIKAGLLKSFQHYVNLDTTEWKLDRMLERHRFTSMAENLASEPIRSMLTRNPVEVHHARPVVAGSAVPSLTLKQTGRNFLSEAEGLLAA